MLLGMRPAGELYREACLTMADHRLRADALARAGDIDGALAADTLCRYWQGEALAHAGRPHGELIPVF